MKFKTPKCKVLRCASVVKREHHAIQSDARRDGKHNTIDVELWSVLLCYLVLIQQQNLTLISATTLGYVSG